MYVVMYQSYVPSKLPRDLCQFANKNNAHLQCNITAPADNTEVTR